jgi:hypothetical protein
MKACPRCLRGALLHDFGGLVCLACGYSEDPVTEATMETAPRPDEDDEPLPLVKGTDLW